MKDLPEVKTSESSQRFCPNKKFIVMDYLPCTYKNPYSKYFAAHFETNLWLKI